MFCCCFVGIYIAKIAKNPEALILLASGHFFNSRKNNGNCKYSSDAVIEGSHHRHALVHAALIRMAVCLVGKCGVGVTQNAGQGDNIRAFLYPVGGEGMPLWYISVS